VRECELLDPAAILQNLIEQAREYHHQEDGRLVSEAAPLTIAELMAKEFPPIKWIIKDILPEGLTIIAGPSKLGKSWLSLDIALGVSFGGTVLNDIPVEQGDVYALFLEDSPRRIQSRIQQLMPHQIDWGDSRLKFETTMTMPPALDAGGLEQIKKWYESADNPRLVIIDVLAKVQPEKKSGENEYTAIYRGLNDLHAFATEYGLSILVITHTVKGSLDGDPFDKVSGTRAFTALPDACLVMDKDPEGFAEAILYGRGRDLNEFEHALSYDNGRWSVMGDTETLRRSSERTGILDALKDHPIDGYSPADLMELVEMPRNNLDQLLFKMKSSGEIKKLGRGRYVLPKEKY
jgi:RecA-family ATPase